MISSMLIHPDELSRTWIDRMAENGITVLGIHPVGGKEAHRSLLDLLQKLQDPAFKELIDYAKSKGLQIEYEFHAAGYLLPRSVFNEHPEYFRINAQGQRTPDWNFCVSDEAAMQLVTDRAMQVIKALYGSRPYYYLWLDDHRNSHCNCEKCQSFSASDQQMLVLNRIAKALFQWNPDAKLAYLAYCDRVIPPTIKPESNIFLEYAPFEKYVSKTDAEKIRLEQASFSGLCEAFGKNDLKILEYWYDNSMFSKWTKPPKAFSVNTVIMEKDIAFYKAQGAQQLATFACYLGQDYEELYGKPDITPFAKAVNHD